MPAGYMAFAAPKGWTKPDRQHAVTASFLGWTLDAFDFFILTFVFPDIAAQFSVPVTAVSGFALTITLVLRPLGAFVFGRLADTYGRRPILMLDIACYSVLNFLIAFTPNIWASLRHSRPVRYRHGRHLGRGRICASLSMETGKAQPRAALSPA